MRGVEPDRFVIVRDRSVVLALLPIGTSPIAVGDGSIGLGLALSSAQDLSAARNPPIPVSVVPTRLPGHIRRKAARCGPTRNQNDPKPSRSRAHDCFSEPKCVDAPLENGARADREIALAR